MALRSLMLRKQLSDLQKKLEDVRTKAEELATRESELEQDIKEATTDEEKQAVEAAIDQFESEKAENKAEAAKLEEQCAELERELAETEKKTNTPPPAGNEGRGKEISSMENLVMTTTRARELFGSMSDAARVALFECERVKAFNQEIRTCIQEKRALTNVGILIPKEYLGLIRENIQRYSKLYRRVFVRPVKGEGRAKIMGTIPEAVWTEMCAQLNELDLSFNQVEVDGYKVGGFIPVCNAILEDSDIDLAAEIITVLGQAIGLALDKAILFGKGIKMPLGVLTRLAQTSAPENYPADARPWVDLHTSNIKTIDASLEGVELYKALTLASGAAKGKYSRGEKVWCMNETTKTKLSSEMLTINASGAVVSGINGTLPVIGGDIEIFEFIPDNYILGGYFDVFCLAERSGTRIAQSEHVRFLQEETIFKGSARYDGLPVIPESFVAIGIGGVTPSPDTVTFAEDKANPSAEASKLKSLEISGVTLNKTFDPDADTYTGTTTAASGTISAVPQDGFDAVSITYNDNSYVPNGGSVKWVAGAGNVVKISVKDSTSGVVSTYTVTVTKS